MLQRSTALSLVLSKTCLRVNLPTCLCPLVWGQIESKEMPVCLFRPTGTHTTAGVWLTDIHREHDTDTVSPSMRCSSHQLPSHQSPCACPLRTIPPLPSPQSCLVLVHICTHHLRTTPSLYSSLQRHPYPCICHLRPVIAHSQKNTELDLSLLAPTFFHEPRMTKCP